MGKTVIKNMIFAASALIFIACGSSSSTPSSVVEDNPVTEVPVEEVTSSLPSDVQDAIDSPKSILSEELINTLSHMGNEERLAYDVYNYLSVIHPDVKTLQNIPNSEYEHISAVQELIQKYKLSDDINFTNVDLDPLGYQNTAIEDMEAGTYDISKIQDLYDYLIDRGKPTEITALEVGCIIEVVDIYDLDEYIDLAQKSNASDIETVFNFLRTGSYNHYDAFDNALKNKGEEGCCPLALEFGHTECPDYQ